MKIIESSAELINPPSYLEALERIEGAARTCYKSEDRIKDGSAEELIRRLIKSGHESVLEHVSLSVRIICDRGVSHELVRHRLASYSQESTRYCNYSGDKFDGELTFINPSWYIGYTFKSAMWLTAMEASQKAYMQMLKEGASPQEARSVLPNSLKTELVMTCNIREWRLIFNQRCSLVAHPDMRALMIPLRDKMIELYPIFFEDLV